MGEPSEGLYGNIRFCVDYRITKMDAYLIPRMDKMIERVGAAKYITTLDMPKGYCQIHLEESAIEKSTFITSSGLYDATFQRMMKEKV
jgi:hypothetical protein